MSFDREAALKSAEKAIRLGRVDAAIAEYPRIVEAQPRDWNSANALGDLYVKSKQVDKGIEQYTRIADHLAAEGFLPKAAALYKKILKFKPDQESALLQSAEISAKQGLVSDAKTAFRAVAERRRTQRRRQGRGRDDDPDRPARSRGPRRPARGRQGRARNQGQRDGAQRVPRSRVQTRQERRCEAGAAGVRRGLRSGSERLGSARAAPRRAICRAAISRARATWPPKPRN